MLICSLFLLASATGCEKLSSAFKRVPLPDMGPRIDKTVRLTFDPAFTDLKMGYVDSCGSPHDLEVGAEVESVMIDAASQNFQGVSVTGGVAPASPPDTEIQITLQRHALKLWTDHLYDRVPADLTLEAQVSFKDRSGKELGQQTISIAHNQRLILEPTQHRCNYGNIDEFIYDSGVAMSVQFIRAARTQFAGAGPPAATVAGAPAKPLAPSSAPKGTRPSLSFKATALDENGNLLFEGGERMRIRVDVVNAGDQELPQVTATLAGTPSLLSQFPATTLSIGRLTPGQSRALEFAATLPQSVQTQKAELQVTVSDPSSEAPAPQTLSLSLQPTGVKADDVDQIPAVAEGFKRPHSYLLSVGIGAYRDQQLSSRKYGASDAEMVSTYFQSLGGLPASNVRLLQDWKALRPDLDEALLDWLPAHAGKDAVVMVYFAGQATVSPAGEVFLVPYDGNISTTSRAYPLKDLQAALSRLKTKQTILLFDGIVSRLGSDGRGKGTGPLWNPSGGSSVHLIATNGFGRSIEDEKHRHGLFTYYLLRALRGEADTNRDGEVTLGEAASYLSQKVVWASKTQYGLEQRPLILPPLKSGDQSAALVLTKLATISAGTVP